MGRNLENMNHNGSGLGLFIC